MEYVARLLKDEAYLELLQELEAAEEERLYCRHGFSHLMDVARLGRIYALEEDCDVSVEQIYLAALLHDIGRTEEYKTGISHAEAGQKLAGEILLRIGYPKEQSEVVLKAIGEHRGEGEENGADRAEREQGERLAQLLRHADHACRPCFLCRAADSCKWSESRRNTPEQWM